MTRSAFIKQVYKGVYIYIQDKNKIVKVSRIFPVEHPAYAEYETANGPDAAFYTRIQIVPPETLAKILNRKKNAETNAE